MARDEKGPDKGRVKVRVIEFEMDASNQTLRDSIRDIVGAIGRGPAALVNRSSTPALKNPASNLSDGADQEPIDQPIEEFSDIASDPEETPGRIAKPRSPPRSPVVLDTLDLTSGNEPLKPFLQAHSNNDNDNQRYLLIAYWLKTYRNIPEVTMDHVHTAYRLMGWSTPADASLPLRGMKNQGLFKKGTGKGAYAIIHIGENRIIELTQKGGSATK
jgi:hypothetical protein